MRTKNVNLYIHKVSRGRRKSCPTCEEKLNGLGIYSVSRYFNAHRRKVCDDFCMKCQDRFLDKIEEVESANEKTFVTIVGYEKTEIPRCLLADRFFSFLKVELSEYLVTADKKSATLTLKQGKVSVTSQSWLSTKCIIRFELNNSICDFYSTLEFVESVTQDNLQLIVSKLKKLQELYDN